MQGDEKPHDGGLKYIIGLLICTGIRVLPRPPNFEPIMATAMPYSKGYGWLRGMIFSMAAILLYDLVTQTGGPWSMVTASTYAICSLGAYIYLKNKPNRTGYYVKYAVAATLFYDLVTGVMMGHLIFKMPLEMTVFAQIPFTLMHLASSTATAMASPTIYKWIVANPDLSLEKYVKRILVKRIG